MRAHRDINVLTHSFPTRRSSDRLTKREGHEQVRWCLCALVLDHGLNRPEWDGAIGRRPGAVPVGHGAERSMKVGVVAGGRQEEGIPRANLCREAIDADNRQLPYRNGQGSKTKIAFAEKRVEIGRASCRERVRQYG